MITFQHKLYEDVIRKISHTTFVRTNLSCNFQAQSLGIIFQYNFHIKVVKKSSDIQKVKEKSGKKQQLWNVKEKMKRENNVTHVGWVKINSGWGLRIVGHENLHREQQTWSEEKRKQRSAPRQKNMKKEGGAPACQIDC